MPIDEINPDKGPSRQPKTSRFEGKVKIRAQEADQNTQTQVASERQEISSPKNQKSLENKNDVINTDLKSAVKIEAQKADQRQEVSSKENPKSLENENDTINDNVKEEKSAQKSLTQQKLEKRKKRRERQARRRRSLLETANNPDREAKKKRRMASLESAVEKLKSHNNDESIHELEKAIDKNLSDDTIKERNQVETTIQEDALKPQTTLKDQLKNTSANQKFKDRFKQALKKAKVLKEEVPEEKTSFADKPHLKNDAFSELLRVRQNCKKMAMDYLKKMGEINPQNNARFDQIVDALHVNLASISPKYKKIIEELCEARDKMPIRVGRKNADAKKQATHAGAIVGSEFSKYKDHSWKPTNATDVSFSDIHDYREAQNNTRKGLLENLLGKQQDLGTTRPQTAKIQKTPQAYDKIQSNAATEKSEKSEKSNSFLSKLQSKKDLIKKTPLNNPLNQEGKVHLQNLIKGSNMNKLKEKLRMQTNR